MEHLISYSEFNENFNPGETYTFLQIKNKNLLNMDLHSISFKNCIIEESDFSKTIFANSDFDSSYLENSIFDHQSFQNSDIISCNFKKCKFKNVNFKGSTIINNIFENCVFISCDFNHVTMSDTTFSNCFIDNMNLRQSSTSLNNFYKCNWHNSNIKGNFVFNLIINSTFENSKVEPKILSSNFGIDNENLIELGININELANFQQNLLNEKELINAAIVELNSNKYSYDYSMVFCVNVILQQIQTNIIVRSEEIRFIQLILEYLIEQNMISPITIIQLLSLIDNFKKSKKNNIAINKSKSNINYIHNILFKAYQDYVDKLDKDILSTKTCNSNVIIKFVFKEKPSIETCALLSELQNQLGIKSSYPIQIKTEKGSFIEWIEAPDNIIKCLQLLVSIIGVFIKKPKPSKTNKKVKQDLNDNTSQAQQTVENIAFNLPDTISKQISQIQTEKDISNTINVFVINEMTIKNDYRRFNKNNINTVEYYYK